MKIYLIMNEWDVDGLTLQERKGAFQDYANAKAELDMTAWKMIEVELPHDCEHFDTETDIYYIEEVETDD